MYTTLRRALISCLVLGLSLGSAGCLTGTHAISKQELIRLSNTSAKQRHQQVQVVQGFSGAEDPPEARPVGSNTTVVYAPVFIDGGGGGRSYGGRPGLRPKNLAAQKVDDAKAALVIAALLATVLVFTEGIRYDGWVELHPMHPVHLYGYDGSYAQVPLAQLSPETAEWAAKAFVRDTEGPWKQLGRRPLDRVGMTYGFTFGRADIPLDRGGTANAFFGHIQIGGFWQNDLGLVVDIGLGGTEDDEEPAVFDSRYALELQYFPLAAGPVHAGVFGQVGLGARFQDGSGRDTASFIGGGGGLVQLELTTRLALMARAGVVSAHGETSSDLTLGVAIY